MEETDLGGLRTEIRGGPPSLQMSAIGSHGKSSLTPSQVVKRTFTFQCATPRKRGFNCKRNSSMNRPRRRQFRSCVRGSINCNCGVPSDRWPEGKEDLNMGLVCLGYGFNIGDEATSICWSVKQTRAAVQIS